MNGNVIPIIGRRPIVIDMFCTCWNTNTAIIPPIVYLSVISVVFDTICINVISKNTINKIRACYSHQTGEKFSYIKVPQGYKTVTGDNWYIIFSNQGILDSCYLSNDKFAVMEFNSAIEQLMTNQQVVEEILVPRARK